MAWPVFVFDTLGTTEECWPQDDKYRSILSGYGLDDRAIEFQFPAEAKGFFL
jgi:hypothetical protein